jgi:hypothetical protein
MVIGLNFDLKHAIIVYFLQYNYIYALNMRRKNPKKLKFLAEKDLSGQIAKTKSL